MLKRQKRRPAGRGHWDGVVAPHCLFQAHFGDSCLYFYFCTISVNGAVIDGLLDEVADCCTPTEACDPLLPWKQDSIIPRAPNCCLTEIKLCRTGWGRGGRSEKRRENSFCTPLLRRSAAGLWRRSIFQLNSAKLALKESKQSDFYAWA